MSNYIVNESDLNSVADAIRRKNATQSKLTFPEEFVSKIDGISGSSVQPDWTQNDETAADYIKNRPGAYEDVENTQVATGTFIGEQDQFEVSDAEIVKVGQKFIVTIDGESTTYTASAVTEQEGSIQFGTTTYEQIESGNPPENGYIFCFLSVSGQTFGVTMSFGTYVNKTWTLVVETATIRKIAEKYLDLTNTEAQIAAVQETATNAQTAATDAATQTTKIEKEYDPNLSPLWGAEGIFSSLYDQMRQGNKGRIVRVVGNSYVHLTEAGQGYGLTWSIYTLTTETKYYLQPIYGQEYEIGNDTFVWDGKSMGDERNGTLSFDVKTGLYSWSSEMKMQGSFVVSPSNKHKKIKRSSGNETPFFAAPVTCPYVATPALLMISSTADSTKLFRVTVDDSGALTATEVDM